MAIAWARESRKATGGADREPNIHIVALRGPRASVMECIVLLNSRNQSDGLALLRMLKTDSVPLVFFDPQYRAGLDKLAFGNEGERQKGRASLEQMSDWTINRFVTEIGRALRPTGYLMLWVDKFTVVEQVWETWARHTALEPVDMITWRKLRMGMGKRSRRISEHLVILQKPPIVAAASWRRHDIEDVYVEPRGWEAENIPWERGQGPHRKPVQLQTWLIEATTLPGELVVDPAAGSYSTLDAARLMDRQFLGCDLK